jgi:hypothetical protein
MTDREPYAPSGLIATDPFSVEWHRLTHNPGAVRATSKIDVLDDYKNTTTWIVDTFRSDGCETVFIQRIDHTGGLRMMLPPPVAAVIDRQHDRATSTNRRRVARLTVAIRRERGDVLGNPEALKLARKRRKKGRG